MEFFDMLGKKATEAYKVTADKTGKIAKETKIKLKIAELKSKIEDLYEEIGKKVYEKHLLEETISIKDDLEEQCTKIDMLSGEIEDLSKEKLELKDKKQCKNCFYEMEKEFKYCPNCGAKQEEMTNEVEENREQEENEITQKDIDIVTENEEVVEAEVIENLENKEETQQDKPKEKTSLEKIVEIESAMPDNEEI